MLAAFLLRSEADLTVQRDRSPNFVRLSDGSIRNAYTVKILNKQRSDQTFDLMLDGLPNARLSSVGADTTAHLVVHPDAVGTFRIFVTVPAAAAPAGSRSIEFAVRDAAGRTRAMHGAVFVGPER